MKKFIKSLLAVVFVLGSFAFIGQVQASSWPTVGNEWATDITSTSVTLNGEVNPNGAATTAWFKILNGSQSPTQNVGSGNSLVTLNPSYSVTGLTPNTSYTFYVGSNNANGTTNGGLVTFSTLPNTPPPSTMVSLSASEQWITPGQTSQLSWVVTGWTGNCTASAFPSTSQWSGSKLWNGNPVTVSPSQTTTYTLTCNGASDQVTVNVTPIVQPDAPVVSLNANPGSIQQGQSSTLIWSVQNATSCTASGGWSGFKSATGGSTTVSPSQSTLYTLTCTGQGGTGSASANITVTQLPPPALPSVTLTATPTSVSFNGSTILVWTVSNATSCVANSNPATAWTGNKSITGGSTTITNLTSTTFFNIFCTNALGQSDSATATVTVSSQPPTPQVPTVTIKAMYTDLAYGEGTDILWYPSANATSCVGTGGSPLWAGPKSNYSDSFYASGLTQTYTFIITCSNSAGTSLPASVTVHVAGAPVHNPTVTTNSPTNIGISYATLNGSVNANGNSNVTAWFEWGTNSNYGNQTPQNNYGNNSTSFNYALGGLQSNTTYYYRAVAQGPQGVIYGAQMSFTTLGNNVCTYNCGGYSVPLVTTYPANNIGSNYATLNGYVDPNNSVGTRWFEWSNTNGFMSNSTTRVYQGAYASNISDTLSNLQPNTIVYFRAAAQNSAGTGYGSVLSFVTRGDVIINPCGVFGSCLPTAVTTFATNIGNTSARLNGLGLQNNSNSSLNGYFEWGTTRALGNSTVSGFIGNLSSNPFYSSVFGLQSNTTYFYRAVVTNQNGNISRGDIVSFRTGTVLGVATAANPSLTYRNTTLVTNTNTNVVGTGVSKPSLVLLDTNCGNQVLKPGDILECTVHWKNVSQINLNNSLLRVGFPQELEFQRATIGNFSPVDNAVVVEVGNLAPQQEGSMTFTTQVRMDAELGKIIVVASNFVYSYTGNNGALNQEEVFSYSDHTIVGNNAGSIAGAAIFNGSFMPNSLAGWLLLILLILLVLLALKSVFNGARPQIVNVPPSNNGGMH